MFAVFATAWRVVLQRTRADWLILTAAAAIVLLATTLLATGPIYAGAVAVSGLHRTLHDAPTTSANVEITSRSNPQEFRSLDDRVVTLASDAFRYTGARIVRSGRSDSFALPMQPGETVTDLAIFGFYDDIEQHATLLAGQWPDSSPTNGVGAAISDSTAALLDIGIGSELRMESRRDPGYFVTVTVVGVYQVTDAGDPYWWEETLELEGIQTGQSFTTFGPFVVTPGDFFGPVTTQSAQIRWRIYPIWTSLTVQDVAPFRAGIEALRGRLNADLGQNERFAVNTGLVRILRDAERSLLVTRTGVMILTVQLAVLAGYALVLTAGLLIEQRRVETALLRSRGADSSQIGVMSLMEGVVLAVPAALAGPWIAALSLRLLNFAGPLTAIDLTVQPELTRTAYILAGLAAVACVVVLTLPAFLAARSFVDARAARGRQQARGIAQRAGVDLALIAIAVIGYWQLRRYGAPITATVHGRLGLDPFLVAAPALGLLAGAVVALRVIPLLARAIDRLVVSTRGLVPSLGAWQVSRRPGRYSRAALLLVLAMAIGLFSLAYTSTWTASQQDQADHQTGADIRVVPDRRTLTAIPALVLADAHRQIEGIQTSMPAAREPVTVSRSAGGGRFLALDAAAAAGVVKFRPDLANLPLADMMDALASRRPQLVGLQLPADAQRVSLTVELTFDELPQGVAPPQRVGLNPRVSLVFQDARGLLDRRTSPILDVHPGAQVLEFQLAEALSDGRIALPDGPLSLVGIELRVYVPFEVARTGHLEILNVATSPALTGDTWVPVSGATPEGWQVTMSSPGGVLDAPTATLDSAPADVPVSVTLSTGSTRANVPVPVDVNLRPGVTEMMATLPVLVSARFLELTETAVGDRVSLQLGGPLQPLEIVGVFEAFPTLEPQPSNMLVADLGTVSTQRYLADGRILAPSEWWLDIDEDQRESIVAALWSAPYSSARVFDRVERATTLRTDPVALGIIGALSLGFVAAALFAAIGFVVNASVSARERLAEFALLRALGLSPRQLSGWLSLENSLLVVISLIGGTLLGLTLAWLILPLVTLTQGATAIVPGLIVDIPWRTVLLLELVTLLALALVVGILAVALRRLGLGSVLRMGED
jgi:hypothetical protein